MRLRRSLGIAHFLNAALASRVSETLSADILQKMHSSPKPNYPIANPDTMLNYDAFLFGIPTRYGNMPAQLKVSPIIRRPLFDAKAEVTPQAFWDATGKLWAKGQLAGKYAGVFVSTSSAGGGQEMTPLTFMSTLVHQGMLFVPLGYATGLAQLVSLEQVHGGMKALVAVQIHGWMLIVVWV